MDSSRLRSCLLLGTLFFAVVFGIGFVLGTVRTLLLVPRFGERWSELAELPLMVAAILLTARWIVRRRGDELRGLDALVVGLVALALLLAFELLVVLRLRGLTVGEYLETRDPVAGAAYCGSLLLFGAAPWLFHRFGTRAVPPSGQP